MNDNIFGFKADNGSSNNRTSITGKIMEFNPEKERVRLHDLDDGERFTGKPEVDIITKEDKTYNVARIKIIGDNEDLVAYVNFDSRNYPLVKGVNDRFLFYRDAFNVIKSVLVLNGAPINEDTSKIKEVNFKEILEYLDGLDSLTIEAIEYEDNPDYNSLKIVEAI